jgi:hypothetical protein
MLELPLTMKCSLTMVRHHSFGVSPIKLTPKPTGPEYPSKPPNLKTIEVNLHGALYTTKLALHTFIRQNGTDGSTSSPTDTSLTLVGQARRSLIARAVSNIKAPSGALVGLCTHCVVQLTTMVAA